MKENYKVLKIIIIIITIIIIGLLILYAMVSNKNPNSGSNTYSNIEMDELEEIEESEKKLQADIHKDLQEVNIRSSYYIMKNVVEKYFDYVKRYQEDTIQVGIGEVEPVTEETKKLYFDNLRTLYDNEYINENKITNNQIKQNIEQYKEADNVKINQMYFKDINENMTIFVANITPLKEHKLIDEKKLVIAKVDKKNSTFSIIPENDNITLEEIAKTTFSDQQIENKEHNKYTFKNIADVEIVEDFLEKYKDAILYNREEAYDLLDEEYREKRFGDYETFSKYIDHNIKEFASIQFTKYLVNNYDGYTEYVCKDKYENLYIFHEKAIMDYTMKLDTYTLDDKTFLEKYNSSNGQYKVMMNIDKVRQMMNAKDYRTMFSLLDETFKQTYFENDVDQFEAYMRRHFPNYYTIEYGECTNETGIYIQEVKLKDMTIADSEYSEYSEYLDIDRTFYIELGEGTNFVMSFNVYRN